METPLVSVIIPCFNCGSMIKETIFSVQQQTYTNWEVVCVDDGSNDDTIKILEELSSEDSRISYYMRNREPKGGSTCRNLGAVKSHGEYLIFLDGDDLLAPACLEKRVAVMNDENLQFAVFPMASFVNNDLTTAKIYSRLHVREPLYFFASGFGTWQVTSPIIRKSFFDKLNGFDESFPRLQDVEFHIRVIVESMGNYVVLQRSEADCYYRQGGSTKVKVEKLKQTIVGGKKLINLIDGYAAKGMFKNKNKFSLSLLSLYCHMSLYQDKIIEEDSCFKRTNIVLESGLKKYLGYFNLMVIHVLDNVPGVRIRLLAARIVDKIVRKKLAN